MRPRSRLNPLHKRASLTFPQGRRAGRIGLENELKKLQRLLNYGHDLKVVWSPKHDCNLDGEVKAGVIHVYSENLQDALRTLRHEFLDYAVTQLIEPYKEVTNALISLLNKQAYGKKEKLVEKLSDLLSQPVT